MKEEDGISAIAQTVPLATSNLEAIPNPSLSHIPTKDVWSPNTSANHPNNLSNGGGQMITLSPPAGDPAGGQQEPGQGSSTTATGSDLTGDAEGVWSVDIDQAFQEALAIYPPCGRRKIIISDEGKMYGRNELIARYIKLRCGKTRTRKQVSSHIQVLARKKQRDEQAKKKATDSTSSVLMNGSPVSVTSTPVPPPITTIPSSTAPTIKQEPNVVSKQIPPRVPNVAPFTQISLPSNPSLNITDSEQLQLFSKTALLPAAAMYPHFWTFPTFQNPSTGFSSPDMKPVVSTPFSSPFSMVPTPINCENMINPTAIASSKLMLNGFTAYVERPNGQRVDIVNIPRHVGDLVKLSMGNIADKYPPLLRELYEKGPKDAFFLAKCWANVQFTIGDNRHSFAVDSYYTSLNRFDISVSTKVCSFGSEVVEKVEIYSAEEENDHFAFRLENSPMCEFMVKFIKELKKCENVEEMNKVLDNFTVLQVVTDKDTEDTLMVLCFVFAVNTGPESQCSLFRLTS